MNARQAELAIARHCNYRTNVIVPNVFWGMGLHYEADLVVLRPSSWAIEVEIKVSASDIKADLKKRNAHDSILFKELWFAVPEKLADHPDIPKRAGIFAVRGTKAWEVRRVRGAETNKHSRKWTDKERQRLYELGLMRIWNLKKLAEKEAE